MLLCLICGGLEVIVIFVIFFKWIYVFDGVCKCKLVIVWLLFWNCLVSLI